MVNRFVKAFFALVALLLVLGGITLVYLNIKWSNQAEEHASSLGEPAPQLTDNGFLFRDLNKNGKLDTYEDSRAPIEDRVEDILSQMTLEEKAGVMFITMIGMKEDGSIMDKPFLSSNPMHMAMSFMLPKTADLVATRKMNHFNTIFSLSAEAMAKWNNNMQLMAERTRLGIPVTIATDPRHGPGDNPGANVPTEAFSNWPTSLGLAASRDTLLVREFGDVARQEYLSVGIRLALHPMSDLSTEPRWGRTNGTFGEDANLSAIMTRAYINGFQGDSLSSTSVACMSKHFPGAGPQKDGEDAHFPYGKEQVYPGNNFDYHLIPFEEGAFKANTAQVMPYYSIPMGQTSEEVAFGFNKEVITGLLRDKYGFDGVVCTDWSIVSDDKMTGTRPWGVEHLSLQERAQKVIDAGCDQFGGEESPEWVIQLVENGKVDEKRIDQSVRRLMRDKFRLGLFDNPYVDVARASLVCRAPEFIEKGKDAQRKSIVLLKNDNILPLSTGIKIYVEDLNATAAGQYGEVVSNPEDADVIVKRISTPFEPRDEYFLEQFFNQGRLYYSDEEKSDILDLIRQKPSVVVATLDRPTILTDIAEESAGLLADFGTDDDALLDVVFGKYNPTAKLPFELPSSQRAVEQQMEDVPYDSKDPLFEFGHGLSYQ